MRTLAKKLRSDGRWRGNPVSQRVKATEDYHGVENVEYTGKQAARQIASRP
jgi:hypothetical protein